MMPNVATFVALILVGHASGYVSVSWQYIAGNQTCATGAHFGTKGDLTEAGNHPGAKISANTWVDRSNRLWMFGGATYLTTNAFPGWANDMWVYQPVTGLWTWITGSSLGDAWSYFGTKGQATSLTMPGARFGAQSWTGLDGKLYLFGGYGYGLWYTDSNNQFNDHLADLWKFDPDSYAWTWIGGSSFTRFPGVYGKRGEGSADNCAAARQRGHTWVDRDGHMWLYGGYRYQADHSTTEYFGDLWRLDPTTLVWTWMTGKDGVNEPTTFPAEKGVESVDATPGARAMGASWADASGNLWLFGGGSYNGTGNVISNRNDLWCFSTATGRWKWVSGTSSFNSVGLYGGYGEAGADFTPSARAIPFMWLGSAGQELWLFAGNGNFKGDLWNNGAMLNDWWKFDITTGEWSLQGGTTMGFQSPNATDPGGLNNGMTWLDNNMHVWTYGGNSGCGYSAQLWRAEGVSYAPLPPLPTTSMIPKTSTSTTKQGSGSDRWNIFGAGSQLSASYGTLSLCALAVLAVAAFV